MKVLDLFSGIGGFSLGLERAGMRAVAFCEIEPYCRAVLRKHWPDVPCHEDVRLLDGGQYRGVDVVCGGPPCQATSRAAAVHGTRSGATLWPLMLAVVAAARPRWILVEQPAGNAQWETLVASGLAEAGYASARLERSAGDLGAPHERRRVLIVANAVRERCTQVAGLSGSSAHAAAPWPAPPRGAWQSPRSGDRRVDDGFPNWVDRIRALGNAVVPQIVEQIGRAIVEIEQENRSHA